MIKTLLTTVATLLASILICIIAYYTGGRSSPLFPTIYVLLCIYSFYNDLKTSVMVSLWFGMLITLIIDYSAIVNHSLSFGMFISTPLLILVSVGCSLIKQRYLSKSAFNSGLLTLVKSLMNAIDAKSSLTHKHTERVSIYGLKLGKALKLSAKDLNKLECACLLHDVGKIAIPNSILNKPNSLSEEEYNIMKSHPLLGYELLKNIDEVHDIAKSILHHHERYDGGGYPDSLSGEAIPLFARIIAVVDSFDVITSIRPYKDRFDIEHAIEELDAGKGTQFDSAIVDAFVRLIRKDGEIQSLVRRNKQSFRI